MPSHAPTPEPTLIELLDTAAKAVNLEIGLYDVKVTDLLASRLRAAATRLREEMELWARFGLEPTTAVLERINGGPLNSGSER